ncbi:MAG: rod shape-determining protein MreD [Phycisphaerae bacterium]|nr:rod shape-determining protein MreD [Phycisphaerae bacterium]
MRIYWIRFFIFIVVLTVFSAGSLFNVISIRNIAPDLLLIATVFFAIHCVTPHAVAASFAIGFAADLSGAAMGPNMLAFGLLGSLISQLQRVVIMKRVLHQAVAIFIFALIAGALIQLLYYFKMDQTSPQVFRTILGGALYSGAAAPLMWLVLTAFAMWLGYHPQRYRRMSYR